MKKIRVYVNDPNLGPESIHHTIRDLDSSRSGAFINWLGQLVAW